jgi:hypothetical protein
MEEQGKNTDAHDELIAHLWSKLKALLPANKCSCEHPHGIA